MVWPLALLAVLLFVWSLYRLVAPTLRSGVKFSERLSPASRDVLLALARAVWSNAGANVDLGAVPADKKAALLSFLAYKPDAAFLALLEASLDGVLSEEHLRRQISLLLSLLTSRLGALVLTRSWTPVDQRSPAQVEALLRQWCVGSFSPAAPLGPVLVFLVLRTLLAVDPRHTQALGFATTKPPPRAAAPRVQLTDLTVGQASTDVCIIGSGVGGGVVAWHLTRNSGTTTRVIVLEQGKYDVPTQTDYTRGGSMYERQGSFATEDGVMTAMTARTLGGGSTVNWSASFRTPDYVLQEWCDEYGLSFATGDEYRAGVDELWKLLNIHPPSGHSPADALMLSTAAKLGWKAAPVHINTRGCWDGTPSSDVACNLCQFGCASGYKQSNLSNTLAAAVQTGRCQIGTELKAMRILFDNSGRVTGVRCVHMVTGSEIVVKARRVVSSAGSLSTPLVLLRSGIVHPQIGHNLRVHPVLFLNAVMPQAPPEGAWHGPLLTAVVTEFDNFDGTHYGPKLESHPLGPDAATVMAQFHSSRHLQQSMADAPRTLRWFSIVRDRDSTSTILPDSLGAGRFSFKMGAHDIKSMLHGLASLVTLAEAAGAVSAHVSIRGLMPCEFGSNPAERKAKATAFAERIRASEKVLRISRPIGCAHQMSSCRMASDPNVGPTRVTGELWSAPGVWVADASLMPTASGVNPYFSTAALALHVARRLEEDIRRF